MKAETFGATFMDMELPFPCELHPFHPRTSTIPGAKKVLVAFTEPKQSMASDEWIEQNYMQFDLIVTYERKLAHLPNVRLLDYGEASCNQIPPVKTSTTSFVLSTGLGTSVFEGYQLRRDIAAKFVSSPLPFRVFMSSRRVSFSDEEKGLIQDHMSNGRYSVYQLGESKLPLFESMFHVAIENSVHDHYFTEKLVDCFRTYTVPIYFGTESVLDIFDPRGIIFVRNLEDVQKKLAALTPNDYWSRLEAMAKNRAISEEYMTPYCRLKTLLLKEFEWSV